jgi:hypothetical protein
MALSSYQVQRLVTRMRQQADAGDDAPHGDASGAETEPIAAEAAIEGAEYAEDAETVEGGPAVELPPLQRTDPTSADRVELSARARVQAAEAAASWRLPPGTPVSAASIVETAPLPAVTLAELERRAGSFMRPPLIPTPPAAAIPRARRPFAPGPAPEPLEDEDFPEESA